ncbi:PREDICTED: probable acyl-CoA dehydrogenase 6 [Priapulus caudatus]|uniref:Probable acyl-CoA dehydrogenase 6 n=1 Tax=Priapulus caudatus TaxID=37621 RepID=A0ABM1EAP9_PRICU|nr:PREDICTED: probable acyl-CoA dehydrogenase 6 [Priapulus caudatus]
MASLMYCGRNVGIKCSRSWLNRTPKHHIFLGFSVRASSSNVETVDGIYTQEHMEMRRSLRKLIDTEINPHVNEWEANKKFPAHEVFKKLGQAGFLGVTKPVEYGGLGLDYSYSVALAEELGNIHCGGIPMAIGVQTDMATPALAKFGSDALRQEFLAPTIAGDLVACIGVSEPHAGSDVSGIKTRAVKDGDDYIINGSKMWITNGLQADWMCCLANTSEGAVHKNKSLICVPLNAPGVNRTTRIDKMGMHSSDTAQVFFEDLRVPQKNLIGEEGMGFTFQMIQFQEERMFGIAGTLTPMERCIQDTIDYTRQRLVFGAPVLDNQTVHFRLAELQTEVELLRSLLYRTVDLYVQGNDVTKFASMGKLKAGRLVRQVADSCVQFWGGMGYADESSVSRAYRDFRLLSIGGGSDETMLSIICKFMGTLPKPPKKK